MRKALLFFIAQVALIVLFLGTPVGLYASVDLSPWWIGGPVPACALSEAAQSRGPQGLEEDDT